MSDLHEIWDALEAGNAPKVKTLVETALNSGIDPQTVLNEGLIPAMGRVGEKFKKNEIYVPEVLIAARAMYAGLDVLRPLLAKGGIKRTGKIVIGTVKGDLHDIGKNLVKMMFEGAGFEVIDLGTDVSESKFVEAVRTEKPDLLGMSALLTTTMLSMKSTIEALKQANLRDSVKVIIGGAPVTEKYAQDIGADGYAPDASSAVDVGKQLISA
ncbi:MAG TPA: cobalamin-binding protein [Firmicutes bacterium]|nr:corrinoid protein [Bacillota bacterium]HHY98319.1 cobalamin-binding protein [Bacillota bacterium]